MVYFVLGYSIVWLLILGYTVVIRKEQCKLERQVQILEETVQEQGKKIVS